MLSLLRITLLTLVLILPIGCGYKNTAHGPVALPEGKRTLFIEEVENPTLMTSLDSTLRSLVRDEMTKRGNLRWVSKDEAEAYLQIKVHSFTSNTTVTGSEGETLRSAASIRLEGSIINADDRSVLWNSGSVSASESFTSDREEAEERAVELAVQRLVDRLGQNF